ncbi:UNVERIFIED_CONTAM: hypothetical protein Sradi_3695600 [Sesamum radiatum]|uniref:TOD1/MUCI70 glycosyltransferase-like domain-containing protein n=1 Tax=Sesamum radiatum TaxID=300843 RepID=A0AAW2PXH0_SESRA
MAQYRQSGGVNGPRFVVAPDHVSVGVRGGSRHFYHRRPKAPPAYKISIGFCVLTLSLILSISAFFYFSLQGRGSCEMKILNSSALLVEPLESRKFVRFSLQYTETEEKPMGDEKWEPRFAGFDLAEDDAKYISSCHIAVISCIFGNSDRLRSPISKAVSRFSRKNVCFVMFVDEVTLRTLSSEGQMPDMMGYTGLWKIVVVKNLPYTDMRRVGKIPKFLSHRLFPSARYTIWLDSKLRLQLDPLLILEYFLWRKGTQFGWIANFVSNLIHCLSYFLWRKDVPEGSFIVRAHTPMSNLFSCLWFNEVDRFTPRDQLSFAYTYHKLRRTNPEKPFHLNMFKDCERRKIAKLYHHRVICIVKSCGESGSIWCKFATAVRSSESPLLRLTHYEQGRSILLDHNSLGR